MKNEQEIYMEIQMLEHQMNQVQQQLQQVDQKIEEAKTLQKAMEEFENIEEGSEILVPVTNGIFAKAKLMDTKNLKLNVGSGIVVSKTTPEAVKIMEKQIIELRKLKEKTTEDMTNFMKKAEKLSEKVQNV